MDFLCYSLGPALLVDRSKGDTLKTLTMDFDDKYLTQQTTFANRAVVDEELKTIKINNN